MVSVVMEGVVVRNSFPPGAVPSTCRQSKGSSERDTQRGNARYSCSICQQGLWKSQLPADRLYERTGHRLSTHRLSYRLESWVRCFTSIVLSD